MPGLSAIGGSVKLEFEHPEKGTLIKIILVHPESYLAFANSCTHRGKELEYDHSAKIFRCVSRHSKFDLKGNVLEGKADRSLKKYNTILEGTILRLDF
jgi:Rieske Fe-S protein